jgi:uncharacterized membrane protein
MKILLYLIAILCFLYGLRLINVFNDVVAACFVGSIGVVSLVISLSINNNKTNKDEN